MDELLLGVQEVTIDAVNEFNECLDQILAHIKLMESQHHTYNPTQKIQMAERLYDLISNESKLSLKVRSILHFVNEAEIITHKEDIEKSMAQFTGLGKEIDNIFKLIKEYSSTGKA